MTPDELVEKVARAMWMADVEPYDPADRIPFEQAPEGAQAYCRAEARAAIALALEEAAKEIERQAAIAFDVDQCSHWEKERMLTCAAAIRALIPKERA